MNLQEYAKSSMNISAPRALVSFESDSGSQEDDVSLAEKLTTSITVELWEWLESSHEERKVLLRNEMYWIKQQGVQKQLLLRASLFF